MGDTSSSGYGGAGGGGRKGGKPLSQMTDEELAQEWNDYGTEYYKHRGEIHRQFRREMGDDADSDAEEAWKKRYMKEHPAAARKQEELQRRERELREEQDKRDAARKGQERAAKNAQRAASATPKDRANAERAQREVESAKAQGKKPPYYATYLSKPGNTMDTLHGSVMNMSKDSILQRFPGMGLTSAHTKNEMYSIIERTIREKGYTG